jgi:hypothetical protein
MFNKSIVAALGIAALMGGGAGAGMQPAPIPRAIVGKKQRKGLFNGEAYPSALAPAYGRRGAHASMAQQQRNSRKAKNVKRHRAACRG